MLMMPKQFVRQAALLAVAIGFIVGGLACTSDSGDRKLLTVEEYLTELHAIVTQSQSEVVAINTPNAGAASSGAEYRDLVADYYGRYADSYADLIDEVSTLRPPNEVRATHDDFVDGLRGLVGLLFETRTKLLASQSGDELTEVLDELRDTAEFDEAQRELNSTCADLGSLATENDVDLEFLCQPVSR